MPPDAELTYCVCDDVTPDDAGVVDRGLGEFNAQSAPLDEVRPLSCFAKADGGEVVGGAVGRTWGECCELRQLWVALRYRRRGVATRLMSDFERQARARGCQLAYLETFSFQAPEFYERLGYEVALRLTGFAPGVEKRIMTRRLDDLDVSATPPQQTNAST